MKKYHLLLLIGAVLIVLGQVTMSREVVLQIQTIPSQPADGQTYTSLTEIIVYTPIPMLTDGTPDRVVAAIDYPFTISPQLVANPSVGVYSLSNIDETATQITWSVDIIAVGGTPPTDGVHDFQFAIPVIFPDKPVEKVYWSGTFTIDSAPLYLAGDWYIGSTKVISSEQTVSVYTNNPKFRFVKTSSVPDDSQITTTVIWSGLTSGSKTLTNSPPGEWSDNIQLQDGIYTIDLLATDGTTDVRMSIIDLAINPTIGNGGIITQPIISSFNIISIAGIALIGLSALSYIMERKKGGN